MRTTYVLVDHENVQPTALSLLDLEHCKVILFVGAKQDKINFDVAAALQRMGANATYVKIAESGRNALDFHIAFYAGSLAAAEPQAHLHIVSKDTGFDPLLTHLRSKNISAIRSHDLAELPRLKGAHCATPKPKTPKSKSLVSKTPAEKEALVLSKLLQLAPRSRAP